MMMALFGKHLDARCRELDRQMLVYLKPAES
jgi:hypothetical protein